MSDNKFDENLEFDEEHADKFAEASNLPIKK
jgi:hypothetical protein